jgi:dTDP-glucose 4,6-dehydratase
MRTWFVTGGAGFIGSAFVRLVLDERPDVHVVDYDALTYAGNLENLAGLDATRHTFIQGDICDAAALLAAIPVDTETIVNFAAESHVDRSILSAHEFVRTNVLGTQLLLDAAREKEVRRFCQISTDEVMGSLPDDSEEFFTESSPFKPNSPYAASKAGAEHLVRAAHETFGLDTVITRCGNNYGPRQFPEKFIPLMISNALADQPIPVYGDGRNVRDWIYVDDHCRAVLDIIERGASSGTYNIGARNEQHNIDVAESVLDALGKPRSLITFVEDRLGHDRRYAIDPTKIETELGWKPLETWKSGLEKTVRWYLDNQGWTERVRSGAYQEYYHRQYGMKIA